MSQDIHSYEDMIDMPHHKSKTHTAMPLLDRSAQFAPFAALTGHKEAVHETARLTDEKKVLDEQRKVIINENLQEILLHIKQHPSIKITYFEADLTKSGGAYLTTTKNIKKIDDYLHLLVFDDMTKILIDDIYEIELIR